VGTGALPVFAPLLVVCLLLISSHSAAAQDKPFEPVTVLPGAFDLYQEARWALSPDGAHVYVAGADALSVYRFAPNGREFQHVESHVVPHATQVVTTPDGKDVYVLSRLANYPHSVDRSVVHFRRNATTGRLTQEAGWRQYADYWLDIAVHPTKSIVYTIYDPDQLTWLARDEETGNLSAIGTLQVESDQFASITISSDGKSLYVAGGEASTLQLLALDATTGAPTPVETYRAGENGLPATALSTPVQVLESPADARLYVVNRWGIADHGITAFGRNAATGKLTYLSEFHSPRAYDTEEWRAAFSPDGLRLYVAKNSGQLMVLAIDRASGAMAVSKQLGRDTPHLQGAHDLLVTPDGKLLYVISSPSRYDNGPPGPLSAHHLVTFAQDPSQMLTIVHSQPLMASGWGEFAPFSAAASGDGRQLYVVDGSIGSNGDNDDKLLVFRHEGNGVELVQTLRFGGMSNFDSALVETPDGKFLYWRGNGMKVFARDAATGIVTRTLTYAHDQWDTPLPGSLWGGGMATSSNNRFLYMAGPYRASAGAAPVDAISLFARDTVTGGLQHIETIPLLDLSSDDGPERIVFTKDDRHLYAVSPDSNALAVLSHTSSDGRLSLVEVEKNGTGGVTHMQQPTDVAISPDDSHVYVAAAGNTGIVAFTRDGVSGSLQFLKSYPDLAARGEAPFQAAIAVSTDGQYVIYANGRTGTLVVLARDNVSGKLTKVQEFDNDNLPSLDHHQQVVVSPSGIHVFILSADPGSLTMLAQKQHKAYLPLVVHR
jgi:6-phosphogluconolactonase (cycloisomerase 2 family)